MEIFASYEDARQKSVTKNNNLLDMHQLTELGLIFRAASSFGLHFLLRFIFHFTVLISVTSNDFVEIAPQFLRSLVSPFIIQRYIILEHQCVMFLDVLFLFSADCALP